MLNLVYMSSSPPLYNINLFVEYLVSGLTLLLYGVCLLYFRSQAVLHQKHKDAQGKVKYLQHQNKKNQFGIPLRHQLCKTCHF